MGTKRIVRGDQVDLVPSAIGMLGNLCIDCLMKRYGLGPFRVTGVGPTCFGVEIGEKSMNLPKAWVQLHPV